MTHHLTQLIHPSRFAPALFRREALPLLTQILSEAILRPIITDRQREPKKHDRSSLIILYLPKLKLLAEPVECIVNR